MKHAALALGLALMAMIVACGPITEDPVEEPPTHCVADPQKELLIVDEGVLRERALDFRSTMERLAIEPPDGPAHFRLIAIANRVDLAETGDAEGRLVYAATEGDDPTSPSLPFTMIFEFRLPGDARAWAARWHALGTYGAFDAAYILAVTALTSDFARAENLAQVRIHDARTLDVMRELHLDANRVLAPAGLRRTPSRAFDGSAALRDFVLAHRSEVLEARHELPADMLASEAELGTSWSVPGVDEPLRRAFATSTCDGCHGKEQPTTDGTFHISPHARGEAKLSRFLVDDELPRRAGVLARLACR